MTSVEGFLESIGVPLLHRIPTARRAFYGALGTAIGVNTIMPLLDRLLPASTLNLIVAFVRNGLCVIKDIWPLLLARRLPSIRGRVPLEILVGSSQWAGTLCYVYLAVCSFDQFDKLRKTHHATLQVSVERPRQQYLSAWLEAARETSRRAFARLLKLATGDRDGGRRKPTQEECRAASAEMSDNREASRTIEAELEMASAAAGAALNIGVGRFTLGSGFLFLGGFTMRLFPFAAAAYGLTAMLTALLGMLHVLAGQLYSAELDVNDTLEAVDELLAIKSPEAGDAPPPPTAYLLRTNDVEDRIRRCRLLLPLLYEPNDPEGLLTTARPWTDGWTATVAVAREAVTEKLSRAAAAEGERVANAIVASKEPYKLPAVSELGFSVGARVEVLPRKRAAMISMRCDDDSDGGEVWEVIYERNDPERAWADGEEEEEEVPAARLQLARKQELPPARREPRPYMPSPNSKDKVVQKRRKQRDRSDASSETEKDIENTDDEGSGSGSNSDSGSDSDEDDDNKRQPNANQKHQSASANMMGGLGGGMGMMGMFGGGMSQRIEGKSLAKAQRTKMQKKILRAMGEACQRETNRAVCTAAALDRALCIVRGIGTNGKAGLRQLERTEQAELRLRLSELRYDMVQKRIQNRIDAVCIVLNAVAFCGFSCIILPFYFPNQAQFKRFFPLWTNHEQMAVAGNFVGDVMWTLDPLVALMLPKLLLNARPVWRPPMLAKTDESSHADLDVD